MRSYLCLIFLELQPSFSSERQNGPGMDLSTRRDNGREVGDSMGWSWSSWMEKDLSESLFSLHATSVGIWRHGWTNQCGKNREIILSLIWQQIWKLRV